MYIFIIVLNETLYLASVAQLVTALRRKHRATGGTPVRGPIVAFFNFHNCFPG